MNEFTAHDDYVIRYVFCFSVFEEVMKGGNYIA